MKQQAFTTLAGLRLERRRLLSARLVGGRLRRGLTLMELVYHHLQVWSNQNEALDGFGELFWIGRTAY